MVRGCGGTMVNRKRKMCVVPRKGASSRCKLASSVKRSTRAVVSTAAQQRCSADLDFLLRLYLKISRIYGFLTFEFEGGFAGWFVVLSMHPFVQGAAR